MRPLAVKLSVGLFALFWATTSGYAVWDWSNSSSFGVKDAGYATLWTLVVAAALVGVWRGGPTATHYMSLIGCLIGPIILAGTVMLGWVVYSSEVSADISPLLIVPATAGGLVLTTAGGLLRRREVRTWVTETGQRKIPPGDKS